MADGDGDAEDAPECDGEAAGPELSERAFFTEDEVFAPEPVPDFLFAAVASPVVAFCVEVD